MLDANIDRWDGFAARHRRGISIASAVVFALSCATWAGFIRWPALPAPLAQVAAALGTVWAAVWWGLINPRIVRRRQSRDAAEPPRA